MTIHWLIDSSDVAASDPVGEFSIVEGDTAIVVQNAYLDSWFDALAAGLIKLRSGASAEIDLIEEPDPLIIKATNSGVTISYAGKFVHVNSVTEFERSLQSAGRRFLTEVGGRANRVSLPSLAVILSR